MNRLDLVLHDRPAADDLREAMGIKRFDLVAHRSHVVAGYGQDDRDRVLGHVHRVEKVAA